MTVHNPHWRANLSVAQPLTDLLLDGTKIEWHLDRVRAWQRGERIAPVTVDMALTRGCTIQCAFCFAALEENDRRPITVPVMERFLDDAAEVGVRGISLVGDGESTLSPAWEYSIRRGHELGISMAAGTHGHRVTRAVAERVLPYLTYLRFNFEAATPEMYGRIMGCDPGLFHVAVQNLREIMAIKRRDRLPVTVGMQMVLMPHYGQEILPLVRLALDIGVDYLQIKHCADDEFGSLGIDYKAYRQWYPTLAQAEAMSTCECGCYLLHHPEGTDGSPCNVCSCDNYRPQTRIIVKWSKIEAGNKRSYARCYGAPFVLEMSGSGLIVPCGMLTNARYGKVHIGNIVDDRFRDIVRSDRYWEVMGYLASPDFDARRMCGFLCLQHSTNVWLDEYKRGLRPLPERAPERTPAHVNYL